jgi:glyoxylase-like metal-dependent hydrolase (beta-lactamase superfamily II)
MGAVQAEFSRNGAGKRSLRPCLPFLLAPAAPRPLSIHLEQPAPKPLREDIMDQPAIHPFFDEPTNTISYLVWDPATKEGAVIDPVLDWDNRTGEADTRSAAAILNQAKQEGVTICWVLETHAHADHLTAAPWIRARTGAPVGIGEHIKDIQRIFRPVFDAEDLKPDGGDFDHLFKDGERFRVGGLEVEVLYVPGHTAADVAYRIGNDLFVGDTLFMHDYGTARADFPGGDARQLWRSIQRLLALPPETRLWMCHDYKAPGRDHFAWQSTVALERTQNPHVKDGKTEEEFVRFRTERDKCLATPLLLLPAIQVNIRAGRFPTAEANGVRYLRIPVTIKGHTAAA